MKIWAFCEAFYGRKAVCSLCLNMQNRFGVNVGLVIWFSWHSAHDRYVTQSVFEQANAFSKEIDSQLIQPIRSARKKSILREQLSSGDVYQHLLQAEILLEKSVLLQLDERLTHLTSLETNPSVIGLADYLMSLNVEDADESARFLYASAMSCVE